MSAFINSIKLNNLTHKVNLLQSDITALEAGTIPPIHGDLDMNNNNVKDVNNLIFIDGTASHSLTFDASKFTIDNNEIITTANIQANFINSATTTLNMNNNAIQHVNFIGFQNQDLSVNGSSSLYIAADVVNGKSVMTISEGQGTSVGMVYDTVYNPLPTSGGGGGWVGTATSDLNMATHSLTGVQGISTANIFSKYSIIFDKRWRSTCWYDI